TGGSGEHVGRAIADLLEANRFPCGRVTDHFDRTEHRCRAPELLDLIWRELAQTVRVLEPALDAVEALRDCALRRRARDQNAVSLERHVEREMAAVRPIVGAAPGARARRGHPTP